MKVHKVYGLVGYPLTHSFSRGYFNRKFAREIIDAEYKLFPIADIRFFPEVLIQNKGLAGLNVTIPYKEAVLPYLNEIDAVANEVGAVNCIAIRRGRTNGYNTDIIGFERSLRPLLKEQHTHALILGTGGASKAVLYVLRKLGIAATIVSRQSIDETIDYSSLTPSLVAEHKLIINTTPLGMYPAIDVCPPLPYNAIGPEHLLYDLIYNPEETKFLSMGKLAGAVIKNGQQMLELQADASWEIWNA